MKGYEKLSSNERHVGNGPLSSLDFRMMSSEPASRKEAVPKSVEAITMLLTRVMTVDACIDIMCRRAPFASIDRAMSNMRRLCAELTEQCLEVYEFCVADNVLAVQNSDKDESSPDDALFAADPPAEYGNNE